ncbi:MAG: undecaprenyldiphospho-muramoylpentapeptide beta-N-acetylglucosaminyltransferase [Prevotellaceae bacterium]|jgi:UDP-N-acetylglucosamine--N-acetylmuramyl-(pentapeptide) pyrophosphoryl-undecaprenol N-acetylglucosamine transferase|nr:undecaprenyldiphospho-muramoylpentapeptide beta-N-acetylglucosaminyltransferase [Prevotellaceae bacterium]
MKNKRIIVSGGGTGGHIFPAIAIANALRQLCEDVEILFVGAEGRMEMEKVPAAGYRIVGLPVVGVERKALSRKNLSAPVKMLKSLRKAAALISDFAPAVVVGVGGYASAPTLWVAQNRRIPTLVQEQNSYAGVTNKLLARRARKVCVAYEGMERFFPAEKIVFTGNPVRQDLCGVAQLRGEALAHFGLSQNKKTVLVVGGSLGARTLNLSVLHHIADIAAARDVQLIWQTGEAYRQHIQSRLAGREPGNVKVMSFIGRMDYAYAAADVVISRAGASAIAELCVAEKPCILVPSPNVAEDHQTSNARALESRRAALLVPDVEAVQRLVPTAMQLLGNEAERQELALNIGRLALPDAAERIAQETLKLMNN